LAVLKDEAKRRKIKPVWRQQQKEQEMKEEEKKEEGSSNRKREKKKLGGIPRKKGTAKSNPNKK
jgi:hypothetical protein